MHILLEDINKEMASGKLYDINQCNAIIIAAGCLQKIQLQLRCIAVAVASELDGTDTCIIAKSEVDIVVQAPEIELLEYAVGTVSSSVATASIDVCYVLQVT